ncbi:MAG: acyl-CoA dehydrogenase family protein [Deltaproteobacteria bacterium]|nr:acyl-CoA dehydrogenase family protein [Deltaproteobacteria bacterium]
MSTFSLDEDQRQIRDSMQRFAAEEMRPIARDCDEDAGIPDEFLEKSWELGLTANIIPEKYGGYEFGRSVLNNAIMAEELAYGDLSLSLAVMVPNLFVLPVMEMGTDLQKEKYLPGFCGDKYKVGTLAIIEHFILFDALDIKTTAERNQDHYVLNGEKCLVPMADKADHFLVVASTSKSSNNEGIDAFIVEKSIEGLTIGEKEKNMGLNALPTNTIIFKDCKIPLENRLGGEQGIDYINLISWCRIGLAATAIGLAGATKDYCIDYAKERIAFGHPIATRQAIAFMLAEMAIEIDSARLLNWKAAWTADKRDNLLRLAYLSKTYASEQAFKVADYGVSILGGHGVIREHPVEMWFRNARAFSMLEGMAIA